MIVFKKTILLFSVVGALSLSAAVFFNWVTFSQASVVLAVAGGLSMCAVLAYKALVFIYAMYLILRHGPVGGTISRVMDSPGLRATIKLIFLPVAALFRICKNFVSKVALTWDALVDEEYVAKDAREEKRNRVKVSDSVERMKVMAEKLQKHN